MFRGILCRSTSMSHSHSLRRNIIGRLAIMRPIRPLIMMLLWMARARQGILERAALNMFL